MTLVPFRSARASRVSSTLHKWAGTQAKELIGRTKDVEQLAHALALGCVYVASLQELVIAVDLERGYGSSTCRFVRIVWGADSSLS